MKVSLNRPIETKRPGSTGIAFVVSHIFLLLIMFGLSQHSAFGQSMGSYTVYSDSWVNDSDPDNMVIVGSGVTQDNNNGYGHTYWVVSTMTSPNGRTANATSSQANSNSAYTASET